MRLILLYTITKLFTIQPKCKEVKMYQKLKNLGGMKMLNYILYCSVSLAIAYTFLAMVINKASFEFNIFSEYAYMPAMICYVITVVITKISQYQRGERL